MRLHGKLQPGAVTLSSAVDNAPALSRSHQYDKNLGNQMNYIFLNTGQLTPGEHTVTVNLTGTVGQPFIVDYIAYEPSFATLAEMPQGPSSQSPSRSSPSNDPKKAPAPVGAIAGGVVGGLLALLVLAGLVVFFRRRKQRRQATSLADSQDAERDALAVSPFIFSEPPPPPQPRFVAPPTSIDTSFEKRPSTTVAPTITSEDHETLRRQIATLTQENAHLTQVVNAVPPPAYGSEYDLGGSTSDGGLTRRS